MRIENIEALAKRLDVLNVLAKIRKEISTEVLPDLSWAGYNE